MNMREKVISKELRDFTNKVIADKARWDGDHYEVRWSNIDEDDRNKIIAYMVELDGKDFMAICENDERFRDDILAKLLGMVKGDDTESSLDFADSVKRAVHHYYEDKAIEYVDDLTNDYTHETLWEQGLHLVRDRNHGDFTVQRI